LNRASLEISENVHWSRCY